MMNLEKEFHYGENFEIECQAIELPYVGESLSMFILLPLKTVSCLLYTSDAADE